MSDAAEGNHQNVDGHDAHDPSPDDAEVAYAPLLDNVVPRYGYDLTPMVGLGGSAGSLTALQQFFGAMPVDSGFVFVVVMHLSPEHESTLAEVLQHATTMPVLQVREAVTVKENTVYVIPPRQVLTAMNGTLQPVELKAARGRRVTIDHFFRTLADSHGPHSAAIVLSGADGDGAVGIKRVKERGGLTIAQDPTEADHADMPRTSIATGMIDWVLPVAEMPERLLSYFRRGRNLALPPEEGPELASAGPGDLARNEQVLRDILNFVKTRTGGDFSYYKRATILRRLARRLQVNGIDELPGYLAFLRTHPGESTALMQDLLISVTNFFRDRPVFDALEQLLPSMLAARSSNEVFRVWVPACATGEEPYTLAMLLCEATRDMEAPPNIQIFATDLDDEAIQVARDGEYPAAIVADVSEERLKRFFVHEGTGGFRVRREVREMVLFAQHDLLKDSPFSRLDLISCRNLLIYLNRDAQARALDIFHFALRPDGRLLLGTSESVDDASALFTVEDKKHRIYRQRPIRRSNLPVPFGASTLSMAVATQEQGVDRPTVPGHAFIPLAHGTPRRGPGEDRAGMWNELHFRLIDRLSEPSVLVDANHDIVHASEGATRYLQFTGGEPTHNLLSLLHPMLRSKTRSALYRATQTNGEAEVFQVPVDINGELRAVNVRVVPAGDLAREFLLVFFESVPSDLVDGAEFPTSSPVDSSAHHLEDEIERMKGYLRDTVEQYEASEEELKASNEELQAMNEELHAATEELETSREELQSINEELITVNQELKGNVDELARANSDVQNLMAATAIAMLFLDRDLRIMRFTPSSVGLFNLIPSDVGRPLFDLKHQLDYPGLERDIRTVLHDHTPIEREVRGQGDRWHLARIRPYQSFEEQVGGVVLTFVDITEGKKGQEQLRTSEERLRLVLESANEYAIFSTDLDLRITMWNEGAERLLGYAAAEVLGQHSSMVFTTEDRDQGIPEAERLAALVSGRGNDERWHQRKDGTCFWSSGVLMPMRDASGTPIGFVKVLRDETESREAQRTLEANRRDLLVALADAEDARAAVEASSRAKDQFLAVLSHELRTPLTPVLMAVHALERQPGLSDQTQHLLSMIRRNVHVETRFIDDLLDVTRISHGKLEIVREPMDVHAALKGAIDISKTDIDARRQRLTVAFDATRSGLLGDPGRLEQAFWNVLKNASKFSPESGAIAVRTHNDERVITLEFRDNGIGIEEENLTRIFDPYTQGNEKVSREYGGLGLGLSISRATVMAHGGTIRAESAGAGQGATFIVELPLA